MEQIDDEMLYKIAEEDNELNPIPQKNNPRKTGRLYRRKMNELKQKKMKINNLYDSICPTRYYLSDYNNIENAYIKERSRNKYKRFLKKEATKKTRRNNSDYGSHSGYKKDYDLWWILY